MTGFDRLVTRADAWGGWLRPLANVVGYSVTIAAALTAALTFLASVVLQRYGTDIRDALGVPSVEHVASLKADVDAVKADVSELRREVLLARVPQSVAVYNAAATRVQGGRCVPGEECVIVARVRRADGAETCTLKRAEIVAVSEADGQERVMHLTGERRRQNIGLEYRTLELLTVAPNTVPPGPAYIVVTTFYDCPWQLNGEPPALGVSPPIPLVFTEARQ